MKTSIINWKVAAIAMAASAATVAHAETPSAVSDTVSTNSISVPPLTLASQDSIWQDEIGSGFRKGAHEFGMNVAYAPGTKFFGTSEHHELLYGTAQMGWVLSDVLMKDTIVKGNWEVLAEGFGGLQINRHAYLTGVDGFIRYDISTGTRVVPFFEGGLGILSTDIGPPDLGSNFQFNEKAGIGAQFFISRHWAASVEWRFMHISNASIDSPNLGVNSLPVLLGLSYFF